MTLKSKWLVPKNMGEAINELKKAIGLYSTDKVKRGNEMKFPSTGEEILLSPGGKLWSTCINGGMPRRPTAIGATQRNFRKATSKHEQKTQMITSWFKLNAPFFILPHERCL